MDRKLLKKSFKQSDSVTLPCPTCGKLSLKLDNKKFYACDTAESIKIRQSEEWEFDWLTTVFTAVFTCNNSDCQEHVICSGTGYVEEDIGYDSNGDPEQQFNSYYSPKVFIPPIHFFNIPEKTPESVRNSLIQAFALTLQSPSSAANKVRAAIENLLTASKVPKFTVTKGKRSPLFLDSRISKAIIKKPVFSELKDILLAIKHLGNAGSHGDSEITIDDVFDAYELTSHVLDALYNSKPDLNKMAQDIKKRRGPRKK